LLRHGQPAEEGHQLEDIARVDRVMEMRQGEQSCREIGHDDAPVENGDLPQAYCRADAKPSGSHLPEEIPCKGPRA
jgi:hypothetical protein